MKKKIGILGIVMVVLFGSMAMLGCDNGTTGPGNTDPKTIIITGINGHTGTGSIGITEPNLDDYAFATGTVSNNSIEFSLKYEDGDDWTGSGLYYILLEFSDDNGYGYIYTDGKSLSSLGLSSNSTEAQARAKIPKYNITSATSTIDFSKFVDLLEGF
jgi:hypothetical protein